MDEHLDDFFFPDQQAHSGDDEDQPARRTVMRGDAMYANLNIEQKDIVDIIESTVNKVKKAPGDPTIQRLFFIYGSGGVGKTYLEEVDLYFTKTFVTFCRQ